MLPTEDLSDLIMACNVALPLSNSVVLHPRFIRNDPEQLGQLVDRSYQKLNVLYPFLQIARVDGTLALTVSLTDVIREADGRPVIERYELDLKECSATENLGVEAVSLIEMSDLKMTSDYEVEAPSYAVSLLGGHAFVHIDVNCIEILQSLLAAGDSIEWAAFLIGHAQGPLRHRSGIYLCLYWIASNKLVHFHLASEDIIESMGVYTRTNINNSRRLCQISSGTDFNRIEGRILSKLVDHPLFNYYLAGKSPKGDST